MNSCTTISGRGGLVRFVNLITKYEPRFRRFGRTCKSTRLAVRDRADSEAVFPACPGFCAVQQNKREYLWICGHSLQPTSAYFSLLQPTSGDFDLCQYPRRGRGKPLRSEAICFGLPHSLRQHLHCGLQELARTAAICGELPQCNTEFRSSRMVPAALAAA
jgi:hypothetical protein